MFSEIKSLAKRSAIYGAGDLSLKIISFLLLPLYTRFLSPAEYGILALANVVSFVASLLISLSIHGFVPIIYFNESGEKERREGVGTLFVSIVLLGGVITLSLDQLGSLFLPMVMRDVPFHPYIRIAIWTTYLTSWRIIPLTLLQIQERSGLYIAFSLSGSLLQIGLALWFLFHLHWGVTGILAGHLIAALVTAISYTALALRILTLSFKVNVLKNALIYSLPLIPHSLSSWLLELSDRTILQWYVPLDHVGLYSLAYSYGTLINMVANAMNLAWVPYLFRIDAEKGAKAAPQLAQIGTYFVMTLCLAALFLGLAARPTINLLTPPEYHDAGIIAPWIVAGILLSSLYYFPVNFLFLRRKTAIVAWITGISAVTNVISNLLLIPFYGAIAAAWTTFFSYGIMLLLTWWFAYKAYPIVYEYGRLTILFFITLNLWIIGNSIPWSMLWFEIIGKLAILCLFPFLIKMCGFLSENERNHLRLLVTMLRTRLKLIKL